MLTISALAGSTGSGRRFGGGGGGFGGPGSAPRQPTFAGLSGTAVRRLTSLDSGDMAPTEAMLRGYVAGCTQLKMAVTAWVAVTGAALAAFNAVLAQNKLKPITAAVPTLAGPGC